MNQKYETVIKVTKKKHTHQSINSILFAFSLTQNKLTSHKYQSECTKGGKQLNDVFIVNLGLCSDVQVKSETSFAPQPPPSLNLQRVSICKHDVDLFLLL